MRRFFQEVVFEFPHLALTILVAGRFEMSSLYKGAHSPPGFYDPRSFKLEIYFGDGVGVYTQVDGELPYSWQLIADGDLACSDGKPNRALQLMIERRRMPAVNV